MSGVAWLLFAAGCGGGLLHGFTDLPFTVATGLFSLVFVFRYSLRETKVPPSAFFLALAVHAVPLVVASVVALDDSVLEYWENGGLDSRHVIGLLVVAVLYLASCIAFPRFVRRFARPAAPRLQTPAMVVVTLAMVLVALGALGSRRRPQATRYARAHPIVATIPGTTIEGSSPSGILSEPIAGLHGKTIHRVCNGHMCWIVMTHRAKDQTFFSNDNRIFGEAKETWTIRHDEANRLLIVSGAKREQAIGYDDLAPRRATSIDLARSLAPPLGWLVGGGMGAAIGMFGLIRATRTQRRLERLRTWRVGKISGGALELDDGTLVERPAGALADGVVLVDLADAKDAHHAYREGNLPVAREVFHGTRTEVEATLGERAFAGWALAIAAVSLLASPLFVAAACGLVRP